MKAKGKQQGGIQKAAGRTPKLLHPDCYVGGRVVLVVHKVGDTVVLREVALWQPALIMVW